jgi:pyruvate kinase
MIPEETARALLARLTALRARLADDAASKMQVWAPRIQRAEFLPSARNMAEWLALRRSDLSDFQAPLASLGLSTLGRLDGHVEASVTAVLAALSRIAGDAPLCNR